MKEKPYEKPSIKRIASIEQFIRYVPSIRKSLAERDYEVASAVCALLGHEINNPLTTVIGFTDLLERQDKGLDSEVKKYLSVIAEGARRAGKAVDRIVKIKRAVIAPDGMLNLEWSTKEYSKPKTAIVVEDNTRQRETIEEVLGLKGFEVKGFRDPEEALACFKNVPSSVLVTDINLRAQKSGLDLIRDIHSASKDRNYLMPAVLVATSSLGNTAPGNGRCYGDVLLALASSYKFFYSPVEKPIKLDDLRYRLAMAEKHQDEVRNRTKIEKFP